MNNSNNTHSRRPAGAKLNRGLAMPEACSFERELRYDEVRWLRQSNCNWSRGPGVQQRDRTNVSLLIRVRCLVVMAMAMVLTSILIGVEPLV